MSRVFIAATTGLNKRLRFTSCSGMSWHKINAKSHLFCANNNPIKRWVSAYMTKHLIYSHFLWTFLSGKTLLILWYFLNIELFFFVKNILFGHQKNLRLWTRVAVRGFYYRSSSTNAFVFDRKYTEGIFARTVVKIHGVETYAFAYNPSLRFTPFLPCFNSETYRVNWHEKSHGSAL